MAWRSAVIHLGGRSHAIGPVAEENLVAPEEPQPRKRERRQRTGEDLARLAEAGFIQRTSGQEIFISAGDPAQFGVPVTAEEVAMLASLGLDEGIFKETESKIIINLIRLRDIKVKDIMTPKEKLITVNKDATIVDVSAKMDENKVRHLPVMDGDKVIGVVSITDVINELRAIRVFENEQLKNYILSPY